MDLSEPVHHIATLHELKWSRDLVTRHLTEYFTFLSIGQSGFKNLSSKLVFFSGHVALYRIEISRSFVERTMQVAVLSLMSYFPFGSSNAVTDRGRSEVIEEDNSGFGDDGEVR